MGFVHIQDKILSYMWRYFTEEERADRQIHEKIIKVKGDPMSNGCLCYDEKKSVYGFSMLDWTSEIWNPIFHCNIEQGMKNWPDWPYLHYTTMELFDFISACDFRCYVPQRLLKIIDKCEEDWEERGRQAFDAIKFRCEYPNHGYIDKLARITRCVKQCDYKTQTNSPWSELRFIHVLPPLPYESK